MNNVMQTAWYNSTDEVFCCRYKARDLNRFSCQPQVRPLNPFGLCASAAEECLKAVVLGFLEHCSTRMETQQPCSLIGKDRVRHSTLNMEGSDFYQKLRSEAIAEEEAERKRLANSEERRKKEVKEEEDMSFQPNQPQQ